MIESEGPVIREEVARGDRYTCRRSGVRYRVREVRDGIVYLTDDCSKGWFGEVSYLLHEFDVDPKEPEKGDM